jgi:hypothetical protein
MDDQKDGETAADGGPSLGEQEEESVPMVTTRNHSDDPNANLVNKDLAVAMGGE